MVHHHRDQLLPVEVRINKRVKANNPLKWEKLKTTNVPATENINIYVCTNVSV
jgi:hypothetical protein